MQISQRIGVVVCGALASLVVASPALGAQISKGTTTLKLDSKTNSALKELGVSETAKGGAKKKGATFTLPVLKGGTFDQAGPSVTKAVHKGTITLKLGSDSVPLEDITISKNSLKATIGQFVTTVGTISGTKVSRSATNFTGSLKGTVKLAAGGASRLNKAFSTKAFKKGLKLGTLSTGLSFSTLDIAKGGTTKIALDPTLAAALAANGVSFSPVAPSTPNADGSINFPISGGTWAPKAGSGTDIRHTGGLAINTYSTHLALTNPEITNTPGGAFLALSAGSAKANAADLDLSKAVFTQDGPNVTVSGAVAKLTAQAAGLLNLTFGTTVFQAGQVLGTGSTAFTLK